MEAEYEATIGLEIHAELRTATKMFCQSKNDSKESRPNVNVCPVCMAHPGTLPVINQEAIKHVLRVGTAIGARLADYTEFDRKNYFYPDLPKGYQISQFEFPLVSGGVLNGVHITRVHLEEDTASSVHDEVSGTTMIDYNRAGVPLMELVTEPDMHSAQEAGAFARELQLLLRYLGVSNAEMEKGEMRVEANISVAKKGEMSSAYVEVKNLNSFRVMEKAVAYEIKRQTNLIKSGGVVEKQTLGWDETKQATFPQRMKEGSADYRYFPDPDLPALKISEIKELDGALLKSSLPELPLERRTRYASIGLKAEDAEIYVRDGLIGAFFDDVSRAYAGDAEKVRLISNYISNDLVNIRDIGGRDSENLDYIKISPLNFQKIMNMIFSKKVSSRSAKDLLALCYGTDMDPDLVAKEKGLFQETSKENLAAVIADVVTAHAAVVSDFRTGKEAALEFLVGQAMKSLRGAADPNVLRDMIRTHILQ